jgi:hypothetical protein
MQASSSAADAAGQQAWADQVRTESDLIAERRRQSLGAAEPPQIEAALQWPRVGLALSGGGVRSATFCLGLLRGLAREPVASDAQVPAHPAGNDALLGRIDYLSTVSGGGFVGAMYGRLVGRLGLHGALLALADSASPEVGWLRRYGRYLTPAGARDYGIAAVTYLRAWLAIHLEFMVAGMLLALIVMAPHLWQHSVQALDPDAWQAWRTPWLALALAFWLLLAPGLITAYWAARDATADAKPWYAVWSARLIAVAVLLASLLLWFNFWRSGLLNPLRHSLNWPLIATLGLASMLLGHNAVQLGAGLDAQRSSFAVARLRNQLTRALQSVTQLALGLAGLGLLDAFSWWLLMVLRDDITAGWAWGGAGLGGVALLLLRGLSQPLQKIAAETGAHARDWLPRLLNLAGVLALLVLVLGWLMFWQRFVFVSPLFKELALAPPALRAAVPLLVWAAWVLVTAGNADMANTSSLHSFYRARLVRAYLAVGNPERVLEEAGGPRGNVRQVLEGDDTSLAHYAPERRGGPLHLINTCLNQTRDDASELYNADRKGIALTAQARGLELDKQVFMPQGNGPDLGTLGRWVAVSGAAASPGAGAYTSRGLALLLYFLGVRLGHWLRAPEDRARLRWLSRWGWRHAPKPLMLASEASATFFGRSRPWWFLSDGGHFDNTGVYPLIKRELDFILLADAGCDAGYGFADIENLVRKARIDFGAEIEFYSAGEAAALLPPDGGELAVLSPEQMADNHSCRGVLLARIRYRPRPGPDGRAHRPEGTLLVVKPNLHDALDLDLLAYAQRNPSFPHQSTGDQSFDEAQWESYHRLGEDFGAALSPRWLAGLPGWQSRFPHRLCVAARLAHSAAPAATHGQGDALWKRGARATAIGATLGAGATGTLLLALWQTLDHYQKDRQEQKLAASRSYEELSDKLADFTSPCQNRLSLSTASKFGSLKLLRDGDQLQPVEARGFDNLLAQISAACAQPLSSDAAASCSMASVNAGQVLCGALVDRSSSRLSYWVAEEPPSRQWQQGGMLIAGWLGLSPPPGVTQTTAPLAPVVSAPAPTPLPNVAEAVPATAAAPAPPAVAEALASLQACAGVRLFIQIYDEASREPAQKLREQLSAQADTALLVQPIENVNRSAALSKNARPVPYTQPTLVLHEPAKYGACGQAIAGRIGEPWQKAGDAGVARLRELPARYTPTAGVIELWLPALE